jgi:hypothetical protein
VLVQYGKVAGTALPDDQRGETGWSERKVALVVVVVVVVL